MSGRITILCENTVGPLSGTLGEQGFAALVEWRGERILFDTGQGATLLNNAQRMNRDLRAVQRVVLSHGHVDHCGGLWPLLAHCGPKEVFVHPDVFVPRYRVRDRGEGIAIGLPYSKEFLEGQGAVFNQSGEFREIAAGLFLSGEIPRSPGIVSANGGMFSDPGGRQADPFHDDQCLIIATARGLVILLGCCHAGLINTLEYAREKTGVPEIHAVLGGTHLGFCTTEQLQETLRALRSYNIRRLAVSHCTGFQASVQLAREFPQAFQPANVGYTLEV